ncbi:N-6 DNA methylase [Kiritimatiellaeota bacterium B1221]|nr:N-6 DNA methylase [Kiritimatiellaeota bacterium B1221]
MATKRKQKKKAKPPQTTAQQIGTLIGTARKLMRKDKGLSTDIDRLPLLTWIMFLKFLDDLEEMEESSAKISGKTYYPAIEAPYRWRDWAAAETGITGPELLSFVNQDETIRPDGSKGTGLLKYMRDLSGGRDAEQRRRVIATVFKDITCRMLSGYILRDVINKVNGIHFTSKDEVFTLGLLYETMLREMRDAAGDNGEFYTPRPVVKFMVDMVDPKLGEVVLDPACGTGGFLSEAYQHLEKQCQTVKDRRTLQEKSIKGGEATPLPYLLCQMNLLLHGLDAPDIDPENSLRHKLTDIGEKDRVDVILTNPPFGGEEEAGIKNNFPGDMQTAETALLFLQLIMRKLRRRSGNGRAAVVVPNGTLFGDGVCNRIKKQLLTEFNLHTVVRLPNGVFSPYTPIPSNLLFFDRSGPTKEVWFYEHPLPEGRKNYTKTMPLQAAEFDPCREWWGNREETDQAWVWNFEEAHKSADEAAKPYWEAAQAASAEAGMLGRKARGVTETLKKLKKEKASKEELTKVEKELKSLQKQIAAKEAEAKAKQTEGDALYWPVFNLDQKNPKGGEDVTHLPPEEIAAGIADKVGEMAEIVARVQTLLEGGGE